MDRNFPRSLSLVLKSEGGWSDNPADPGGATMKGVTLTNFRRYVQADATKDDLRHITDAQLATVYRKFYWDAVSGDDLPDGVDYAVFDFAVNSGPGRAAKYLQQIVGVTPDGAIGPATLAAIAKMPAGVIIDRLCDNRLAFLQRLPTWGTFGHGWSSRVESVRAEALKMTAPAPQAAPPASVSPAPAPIPPASPPAPPAPPAPPREPQPLPRTAPAAAPAATIGIVGALILALAHWGHAVAAWLAIHWPF